MSAEGNSTEQGDEQRQRELAVVRHLASTQRTMFRDAFKKQKTYTVFLSSYRNTSESLREREMLWEQEPHTSVSIAFWSSPKLSREFLQKHGEHVFYFCQKTPRREKQKKKQLDNFDYQNVNSLCSRHHYVNNSCEFCVSIELWKDDFYPIRARIILGMFSHHTWP